MTEAAKRNDSSLKTSCASITCCRQKTFAMHCSNTLSNETIVCDRLARKIVLTIRPFLSSSGIDEARRGFTYDASWQAPPARCPCRTPVFQPRLFLSLSESAGYYGCL